jgi:hypothetical protein
MTMLEYHYSPQSPEDLAIKEEIQRLCLRCNYHPMAEKTQLIVEDKIYRGSEEIIQQLRALELYKEEWDRFQSDACYVNEDGTVC